MPKMKTEDDTDIVAFSREELVLLDDYFKGTNAETAYLLGRYCGLRINEAFGLKWENVDLENGTIIIDRQMQYQDGLNGNSGTQSCGLRRWPRGYGQRLSQRFHLDCGHAQQQTPDGSGCPLCSCPPSF